MTLRNARAAFEKAVTDAVDDADSSVVMVYDNTPFTTPSKTTRYITMSVTFSQATLQTHGAAQDYYSGVIQCNVYVPKNAGTSVLATICEAVIDGLTSVNAGGYTDTYSASPRVLDVVGPTPLDVEDRSHFVGIISCQFTARA